MRMKDERNNETRHTPHCPQTETESAGALKAKATPRDANMVFMVRLILNQDGDGFLNDDALLTVGEVQNPWKLSRKFGIAQVIVASRSNTQGSRGETTRWTWRQGILKMPLRAR